MTGSPAHRAETLPTPRHFRARHRLSRDVDFAAVFDARVRKHAGPLTVFALPNETGEHRLGLSIGRRLGNAVTRHRLKRRLREAFRLNRHELPGTYDFVVVARPHSPMKTAGYAELLLDCATRLDREWTKRARRADAKDADAAERGPS